MPGYRSGEHKLRALCLMLAIGFAVIALARPQWGEESQKVERKGVDLVFLLDTSLSMLAEDIKPNRMKKAKIEIRSMVRKLRGDRVGMVAFAGSGFLQTPLTLDYAAFFLFMDAVDVGHIPDPGTSLDQAIRIALQSFSKEELKYKAILIFSDGEDHEGGMEQALLEAKASKTRIYTIGTGTENGAPIPLKDEKGKNSGFKKDRAGETVVTKLKQPLLEKIASETGGLYFPSTPGEEEIDLLLKHMSSLGKKRFSEKLVTEKEDHYQLFLFMAFLFLLAENLVRRKKTGKNHSALVLLLAVFLQFGFLESPSSLNQKGNDLYNEKKYQSAIDNYRKAQVKRPEDATIRYNLATTLYQVDGYREAAGELEKSLEKAQAPALKANALYNYGNTQYRLGNFEEAIEAYKKVLEINPKDEDAKYNLEFLQKEKNRFDKKDQDRQQQNQNKDQKNEDNEDKSQQDQKKDKQDQQQQQNQQNQQDQQQENQNNQQGQGGQSQKQNKQDQNQDQNKQDQQQNQDKQDQEKQDQQNQKDQEKQDQEQKQDQDQKDQEDKQDQQSQQQKDQQGKDQQEKEQSQEPSEQKKDQEQKDQKESQGQDQKDSKEGEDDQEAKPQEPKPEGQQKQPEQPDKSGQDQTPMRPEAGQGEEEMPQGGSPQQVRQGGPLQGQMTKENALRILDALKDSEKDLQDLRKPPPEVHPPYVEKDW